MPTGNGPPTFDGSSYAYWRVRMQAHLEAMDPIALEVTCNPTILKDANGAPIINLVKANAKAKNPLFEAISKEVFARVTSSGTAQEI